MDDKKAGELLAKERERIEGEIARRSGAVGRDAERAAEPQDRADSAGLDYGQARDLARLEELNVDLASVERAEKRLEEGTYGLSIESGEPIGDGRLERLPAAERTADEQSIFEKRG